MMKHSNLLDVSDIPVLCENVPDYRAEAFKKAKEMAKKFGVAFVVFNGLYYHVTSNQIGVHDFWRRKGYKVIHVEVKS